MTAKNFAVIGVAGYIAPRHLKAIKETGNNLVAAYDPNDSVGILDSYSYDVDFFTEFERFDRYAEKHKRNPVNGKRIDYITICSPNYLHDAHIRFGLRIGADVICEKPLVLNPWNIDPLIELEKESGKKIYNILQLRVHPTIVALKEKIAKEHSEEKFEVELVYITPRGNWYWSSWKGDINKSGGVVSNIGVHFFDMLIWIFGQVIKQEVYYRSAKKMAGFIELERAKVRWILSLDINDLPKIEGKEIKSFRSITIDGNKVEFSDGFTDLHTEVYKQILNGDGYRLEDVRPAIQLSHDMRELNLTPLPQTGSADFFKSLNFNN